MASITIRKLDDGVESRLRVRAASNGRSMEEEVRSILRDAVGRRPRSNNLADIIRAHCGPAKGVGLGLPPRDAGREPPSLGRRRGHVSPRNQRRIGVDARVAGPRALRPV